VITKISKKRIQLILSVFFLVTANISSIYMPLFGKTINRNNLNINIPKGWVEVSNIHSKDTIVIAPKNHNKIIAGDDAPFYYSPSINITLFVINPRYSIDMVRRGLVQQWKKKLSGFKIIASEKIVEKRREGHLIKFRYQKGTVDFRSHCFFSKYKSTGTVIVVEMAGADKDIKGYSNSKIKKLLTANDMHR
jgi:hypothetical protein